MQYKFEHDLGINAFIESNTSWPSKCTSSYNKFAELKNKFNTTSFSSGPKKTARATSASVSWPSIGKNKILDNFYIFAASLRVGSVRIINDIECKLVR